MWRARPHLVFRNRSELVPKGHELGAIVAFSGAFLGLVGFWLAMVRRWRARREMPPRAMAALFLVSAGPMIGAALSQAWLYFVPNDLGWVSPRWAELGVPVYLSFAFWEWLASVEVFVYLYLLLVLLPGEAEPVPAP